MGGLVEALWVVVMIVLTVTHIVFAIAVFADASRHIRNGTLKFAPPGVWALATLIGAELTVIVYWIIHSSTLAGNPGTPRQRAE